MDKGPSRMTSESWFCFQRKLRSLFSRALTQKAKPEDTTHSHQTLCCLQKTLSSETREGGGHLVRMGGDGSTVSRQDGSAAATLKGRVWTSCPPRKP